MAEKANYSLGQKAVDAMGDEQLFFKDEYFQFTDKFLFLAFDQLNKLSEVIYQNTQPCRPVMEGESITALSY